MTQVKLTAELCYAKGKKVATTTLAILKMGPLTLGGTRQPLVGRYTELQILDLLRSKPHVFTLTSVGVEALPGLLG